MFREILEGMNQKKQAGMLTKNHFEKKLQSGEHIQIGDDTLWLDSGNEWKLNMDKTSFTKLYQLYRTAYKDGKI